MCACDGCGDAAQDQPHAMVDDGGEFFFPDDAGDAVWFAREYGARPLYPAEFRALFGEVADG